MYKGKGGNEELIPLAYVSEGSLVQIVRIIGGHGLIRRLRDLGLYEGARIKVVKSPGPGPAIVSLIDPLSRDIGRRVALGFGVAMKVLVRVISHE